MAGKSKRRAWGAVTKKKGRHYASYIGPDGRRHTPGRSFETDMDGTGWLIEERRLIDRGMWSPPAERRAAARAQTMTVGQLLDVYHAHLATTTLRESTLQQYKRVRASRLAGRRIERIELPELTDQHVRIWWDEIRREFPDTATTNRNAYKRLRAAAEWATTEATIPLTRNPVYIRGAGDQPVTRHKELPTADELRRLVDALPDHYRVIGVLTLFHGLRIGEALGLKRKHVQIRGDEVTILIRGNVQRLGDTTGKQVMVWQEPKTAAGRRDVPLFPEYVDLVTRHLDTFTGPSADDPVTTTSTGGPVYDTTFRNALDRAKKVAGVRPDITPHYGRNFLITLLAERGATPAEIGALLGQEDLKTILETYMKVRPGRPRQLMSSIEGDQ